MSIDPTDPKTFKYSTPQKPLFNSQSTFYTSSLSTNNGTMTNLSQSKYTPPPQPKSQMAQNLHDIYSRNLSRYYQDEASNTLKKFEDHYQDQVAIGNTVGELDGKLGLEKARNQALEDKLNEALRHAEQEKRHRMELARENIELRDNWRKKDDRINFFESNLTKTQQSATSVNFENASLKQEIKKLNEAYNRKLNDLEGKYTAENKANKEENERLKGFLKEQETEHNTKVKEISRELNAKIRSLENVVRDKDRLVAESESERKALKEYNMKVRMEFEEELKKKVNAAKNEEQDKYHDFIKDLEEKVKEGEEKEYHLQNEIRELKDSLNTQGGILEDLKIQFNARLVPLKDENVNLRDHISQIDGEIERLHIEIKERDSGLQRLERDVVSRDEDLRRIKLASDQEVNRLHDKIENDRRKHEDNERRIQLKLAEMSNLIKVQEEEKFKLKHESHNLRQNMAVNVDQAMSQAFVDYEKNRRGGR